MADLRLRQQYQDDAVPKLREEFHYRNIMEVPIVTKVVVNVGLGEALTNARALDVVTQEIAAVTGQKPVTTRAKKSVANFKVRAGKRHWRHLHHSGCADVGVSGPHVQCGLTPHPGFSGSAAQRVRRAWQLQLGLA